MKAASMMLAVGVAALGLAACDRVREDDARKGVPKTEVMHLQDNAGGMWKSASRK